MHTFYAKVNRVFVKPLQKELKQLGVEPETIINMNKQGLNYVKFTSDFKSVWKIMLYSRMIEGLKLQVAENIRALDEKQLKINFKKVDLEKYLPLKNSTDFKMPVVKAYSFRSKLYHEKMIENIIKTSLNKIAYNMGSKEEVEKRKLKTNLDEPPEELQKKLENRKKLKELPRIDVIFQNDKFRVLIDLFGKPIHMHGYKSKINWGSLRETTACALIYTSKVIEKLYKKNSLLVWDPFCGSGTILIELFFLATERHTRPIKEIEKEVFVNLPFHNKEKFAEFVEEERPTSEERTIVFKKEDTDIHFIASDIDVKSVDALSKNCSKADINKYVIKVGDKELYHNCNVNTVINPTIYHEKINNIFNSFIGDFEVIGKEVIYNTKIPYYNNKEFTLISNVPYGTSQEMSDKVQIKSLYKRFGKFLRQHCHYLDEVYILVNERAQSDPLNFKNLTEIHWEVLSKFSNNGIEVEFLKMRKE